MSTDIARLECARVRIGSALLEAHHLAEMYRAAMHRLERAYMDLAVAMTQLPLAGTDHIGETLDSE